MRVIDLHVHIAPYHMMRPEARRTFLAGKENRECPRLEEIADRIVWGSDWPSPGIASMRGNVEKFLALPIGDDAKRRILYDNAARLFP